MREMPKLEEFDDFMNISHEVKVWKKVKYSLPVNQDAIRADGSIDVKKGPFFGKWKHEVQAMMKDINRAINEQVDWNKPDEVILVAPKWLPTVQYVKFTGK